jgi:hypothetical protein
MGRSDYLTAATLNDGSSEDNFADAVSGQNAGRIRSALRSRYTRGMFNGAVGAQSSSRLDEMFSLLAEAFESVHHVGDWTVHETGEANLPLSLELVQMELIEAVALCRCEDAVVLIRSVLESANDGLHFSALRGISASGFSGYQSTVESYLLSLPTKRLPDDSLPFLKQSAMQALADCNQSA